MSKGNARMRPAGRARGIHLIQINRACGRSSELYLRPYPENSPQRVSPCAERTPNLFLKPFGIISVT